MQRIHPDDIKCIAAEVVRQLRSEEAARLDEQYLASLPPKEQKKHAREQMRLQNKERQKRE